MTRLGLLINPVAGVGGPAGLGGSDGSDIQERAAARGSSPQAMSRAVGALRVIARSNPGLTVLTAAGAMGADAVTAAGLRPVVVYTPGSPSTGSDTSAAARELVSAGAELVLFCGGDGTARDVATGLAGSAGLAAGPAGVAVLGIPAGVKMYSPVFAVSPVVAGSLAATALRQALPIRDLEVLDVDEAELRHGRARPALYGHLPVPYVPGRTQARKAAGPASEHAAVRAAAAGAVARMQPGVQYFLGPGGTMAAVARLLGVPKTPLGVDVVTLQDSPERAGPTARVLVAGASERELLECARRGPAVAMVAVIGGQGFILGRGNQQLSAAVFEIIGRDGLMVVAPEYKLIELHSRPLLVETGSSAVDRELSGRIRVITGVATSAYYPVQVSPQAEEPHDNEASHHGEDREKE